ncbi:16S rRNA (cytidine1402-2'-O)-methyltransferase [Mariprofundus ferrinatatus]|uniref:Ribosomal RNA small subunit methyltransferase I n=1 Tax=Mariprofundus ferrinatatus TaxID=1921087 RepID=A0A2K8LAQ8_9PROT|nr:16S rRNA (cytidine(1402)-2'-O)-methyltransferase [Mariprofundus ferrinatatus]ATX81336.1 16S rRNA (cytidine1402-2'-O)-methyltransferase [Mariprofundus ferrinatatus]
MESQTNRQTATGQLFVVATPIGNLGDITFRAVEVLKNVDLIAAEDTRTSRKLLQHCGISTPMMALHEHNEEQAAKKLLSRLLQGESIALISDAGTPLISDPGYHLVRKLRSEGIRITPIPGASSVLAGLCAAGLPTDHFRFEGFLPRSGSSRTTALQRLAASNETNVILESPHRLLKSLKDLMPLLEEQRELVVARELTKLHEEFVSGSAGRLIEHFSERAPRGEIVLMIGPALPKNRGDITDSEIHSLLETEAMQTLAPSARAKAVARELGISKSRVYDLITGQ